VVGPAIEYMITDSITLGLAYDYTKLKLNNKSLSCPNCGTGDGAGTPAVNGTLKTNNVTTRISYFFG
jgi:opacity protein-like surface antigen